MLARTVESIIVESKVNKRGCYAKKKDPARSFLHSLFNAHATLITQYAELRRHGLSLNFTQAPTTLRLSDTYGNVRPSSACDTAKTIMQENEDLFRIMLDKVEFGVVGSVGGAAAAVNSKNKRTNVSDIRIENDFVKFYLPPTLQPGFECLPVETIPEDIASPIIPLLRYIGPSHFVRLVSALLCERRIILISKSTTRLSMCVRAASSALAQGLLMWRHVLIPVVPPHMLRFLNVQAPYLVGILHQFASRLGKIEGLTDVLCVNLDKNELKTLNMANPRTTVPDMLKKAGKKSSDSVGAVECLARDLDEIVKADQTLWQQDEAKAGGSSEKASKESGGVLDSSESHRNIGIKVESMTASKQSFIEKMKNPMKKRVADAKQRVMSLEEKRQYETSVDAAVAFGKMIRKSFAKDVGEDGDDTGEGDEDDAENAANAAPRYVAPSHDIDGAGGVEPSVVAENEGGEEDVRAALTCFFIHMFGDMGMYLSETHGTFWLDRRKFLLRKKQLGERENSPMFIVLQKFSASSMFAMHANSRIDDMSMTARDRSSIMPHHIPLFDVCSKYLTVHRLDFSLINVRRIVAKTVLACTRHLAVERHVAIRTKALALTDEAPFDGNVAAALSDLVDSCHECNTNLGVVMSVVWHRLNQTDETKKTNMHVLLALHLLKNLVSHGPLTAITETLDGAGKIYELKSYSDAKSVDHNNEVRQAADHIYSLLVDLSALFGRRRRIAFSKAQQRIAIPPLNGQKSWSDYLVGRLPPTADADRLHDLFRPEGISGRVFCDPPGGGGETGGPAPSVVDDDQAPSIMALSRLGENLRSSRMEAAYDAEEEERLFEEGEGVDAYMDEGGGSAEQYLNEGGAPTGQYLDTSGVSDDGQYLSNGGGVSAGQYLDESGPSRDDGYGGGGGGVPMGQHLDESGVSGDDRYFLDESGVSGGPYPDESSSSRHGYSDRSSAGDKHVPPAEMAPPREGLRNGGLQTLEDTEEDRAVGVSVPEEAAHGASTDDLSLEQGQEQFNFSAKWASKTGSSLLDSFNYAVSSDGGASQAGGSQFGSERSFSPLPNNARDAKKSMAPSMGRINEGV